MQGHRSLLKDMAPPAVALPDLMPIENGDAAMEEVEDGELEEEKLPVGHALPNGAVTLLMSVAHISAISYDID